MIVQILCKNSINYEIGVRDQQDIRNINQIILLSALDLELSCSELALFQNFTLFLGFEIPASYYSYVFSRLSKLWQSTHRHSQEHFFPPLWHSQQFFMQWLFWHLHPDPEFLFGKELREIQSLQHQVHEHSTPQATPALKHSQQFFWHLVLEQLHFTPLATLATQLKFSTSSVLATSQISYTKFRGAGLQSYFNDYFLIKEGSFTSWKQRSGRFWRVLSMSASSTSTSQNSTSVGEELSCLFSIVDIPVYSKK